MEDHELLGGNGPNVNQLAAKERNYFQMIEVLMTRLKNMEAKVDEWRRGCDEDQNADSAFCSKQIPALQQELDESADAPLYANRSSIFLPRTDKTSGQAEVNVTFRSAAMTDSGKRLDLKFEHEFGDSFRPGQGGKSGLKGHSTSHTKAKRMGQRKLEEQKAQRHKYEKELHQNLELYVTRSVSELTYRIPLAAAHRLSMDSASDGGESTARSQTSVATLEEDWPIPLSEEQLNPRRLLSYACERIVLPSGERMFKHFVRGEDSCHLFLYMYWFVHCKFFQEDSKAEQEHLLQQVTLRYVNLLSLRSLEAHKDFFFKFYPFVLANAIFWGFYYLCPGSRHMYTKAFKRILYLQCAQLLTGLDMCPTTVQVLRAQLFPDEMQEEEGTGASASLRDDQSDFLPPIASHGTSNGGGGGGDSSAASHRPVSPLEDLGGGNLRHRNRHDPAEEDDGGRTGTGAGGQRAQRTTRTDTALLETANGMGAAPPPLPANPLSTYAGDRSTLRFRPALPDNLVRALPRQQQERFDASRVSPLLQHYLEQHSNSCGRRHEVMRRTTPVHWCRTGGTDTFRKTVVRHKDAGGGAENLAAQYRATKKQLEADTAKDRKKLIEALKAIDRKNTEVCKGGSISIGRYSLELVTEMHHQRTSKSRGAM